MMMMTHHPTPHYPSDADATRKFWNCCQNLSFPDRAMQTGEMRAYKYDPARSSPALRPRSSPPTQGPSAPPRTDRPTCPYRKMTVQNTVGPMVLGALFASMLSGFVHLTAFFYYRTYREDPIHFKALVGIVWLLDTLHTAFIWEGIWNYVIPQIGNENLRLDHIPGGVPISVLLTALVTFFVHNFFAHRIYLLSKRNWMLATPVVVLAVLRLASASVSTWEMFHYQSFEGFKIHANWIFTMGLSVSSAVDVYITGALFYLFQSNRSETSPFNHVIDQLILYAFEAGSLTTIGTIVTMLCWVTMSTNLIFLGIHFVIGKRTSLYANSLLITLNTRENIRRARANTSSGDRERGQVLFLESRTNGGPTTPHLRTTTIPYFTRSKTGPNSPAEMQINVQTSVQFDGDGTSSLDAK
ncbi:unnamed protein product [Mycena citricolor]|uniref:DUF6534 domain-containing protein n=1 Tax=Mycena citricolor TaxID=2018698 RepID=A0AAD2JWD1_9AGAR|nr:unnamed protein product [Mycena citricolor]